MQTDLFFLELQAGRVNAIRKLRAALKAESGNVVRTAQRLKIPVSTFQDWRRRVPLINEAIEAARKLAEARTE
jgi:hypothetical protein